MRILVNDIHVKDGFLGILQESKISYATIELQNMWNSFIRSFYLSCFFSATSVGGKTVSVSKRGINQRKAIDFAIKHWKPKLYARHQGNWRRRDEPPWHDPKVLLKLAQAEGFSNYQQIENAFSIPDRTLEDLPVFRNFFSHKNISSKNAAQNRATHYGISSTKRPSIILISRPYGRPQPLILDWCDHISLMVDYLCQ
ncbi:MAG: hypothetical protein KJ621_17005 [Proteobacteria bacterium]|nr:hypothetical protein [Pseudomonadota bacterium]